MVLSGYLWDTAMILKLNPTIKVQIRYVFSRGDTLYWQRRVPKDLESRYGGPKVIKVNLNTTDLHRAAQQVERLNKQFEAEWEAMRGNKRLTPANVRTQALLLLKKWNLAPYPADNDEASIDHFIDTHFVTQREAAAKKTDNPDETYRSLQPEHYASPVEVKALELLTTKPQFLLSDAVKVYLDGHRKKSDEEFRKYTERTWNKLIDVIGDKPFKELSRDDANRFRDDVLADCKTTTALRLIRTLAAVVNTVIKERELDRSNPFTGVRIPDLGVDAKKRKPFTTEALKKITEACKATDDDMRWMLALQIDLGCRIGEVAGLALADLVLDAEIPHVDFQPHPWRSLKTAPSKRKVPLVGVALWAAQRIKESATEGQRMVFPRYCTEKQCKSTHASNTLNDWIRARGVDKTTHEFRHTMADRLREVGCPEDIRKSIGGWAGDGVASKYGDGYSLRMKLEWLGKVVLKEQPEVPDEGQAQR